MMKRILYIASILAVTFTACDPMEDTYDELDIASDKAFFANKTELATDYTLVAADYALSSNDDVKKYKNFSNSVNASKFIPEILDAKLIYGETGIEFNISYDYYQGSLSYLIDLVTFKDNLAKVATKYTLIKADYDGMGTDKDEPGKYDNFSGSTSPADFLPAFLAAKYPSAATGLWVELTYKYFDGGVKDVKDVWAFDGTKWASASPTVPAGVDLYELTEEDYDSMGDPGSNDNFSSSVKPDDYLPKFLTKKDPYTYAKEGDKVATLYRFYKGKIDGKHTTVWESKQYTFDGAQWNAYQSKVVSSSKYTFKKRNWIFVPPLKMIVTDKAATKTYTLTAKNYDLVGDGAFNNFYLKGFTPEKINETIIPKITRMLKSTFTLEIGDVYEVTYDFYDGTNGTKQIKLEVVADI